MDDEELGLNEGASYERGYAERAQKFWSLYVSESEQYDKITTETWKADMDSTLIFAGLFSAAVTAFLVESYKLLQVDSNDVATNLLAQLLAVQIVGASLNTSSIPLPITVPNETFQPSVSAIAINVLWSLSLSCSLATALCVTLVQQWIRDYLQRIQETNQPQRRATIRGIMFHGIKKWKMKHIVEYIPTLLHFSLFSFFAGLCTFLWNVHMTTAGVVILIIVCCLGFYIFATIAPLLDRSAPYETPFSSLLWYMGHRLSLVRLIGSSRNQKFSEARRELSLNSANHLVQDHIQAVSWVYDRTSDDRELQELLRSIPGLLSSHDGQNAWRIFLAKTAGSARQLEARIGRLLKTCSSTSYLDEKTRQLRATLCIDALLVASTIPRVAGCPSNPTLQLQEIIVTPWEDDGSLATKSACAESVLCHNALLSEIPFLRQKYTASAFRDLSTRADQALRDIDDMRAILEIALQESVGPGWDRKMEIANLLRTYFAVLGSRTSILNGYIIEMRRILPKRFPILSWYYSLTPANLRISYRHVPYFSGDLKLDVMAYHVLGYLRLHEAYPPISDIAFSPAQRLFVTWPSSIDTIPQTWNACFGMKKLHPLPHPHGKDLLVEQGKHLEHMNPQRAISHSIHRELWPISTLLNTLEVKWGSSSIAYDRPRHPFQEYASCHIMSLITRDQGPFSLLASVLEAVMEDEGMCGLLIFISTFRVYRPAKAFHSVIIERWLNTTCPVLLKRDPPRSKGFQILLVITLLEILAWERESPPDSPCPISTTITEQLIHFLANLTHELPVEMAERALGTTLDEGIGAERSNRPISYRAGCVHNYVKSQRKRLT